MSVAILYYNAGRYEESIGVVPEGARNGTGVARQSDDLRFAESRFAFRPRSIDGGVSPLGFESSILSNS